MVLPERWKLAFLGLAGICLLAFSSFHMSFDEFFEGFLLESQKHGGMLDLLRGIEQPDRYVPEKQWTLELFRLVANGFHV